jgi:hypothetical protein
MSEQIIKNKKVKNPDCEYPYCDKQAVFEFDVKSNTETITYYYCYEHAFEYNLGYIIPDIFIDKIVITRIL